MRARDKLSLRLVALSLEFFSRGSEVGFALVVALVCGIRLLPAASGWLFDLLADLRKLPVGALPAPSFPVPGLIMSPLL